MLAAVYSCLAQQPTSHSYLALGDSYTIGEQVPPKLRWPMQLVDSLEKMGIPMRKPRIIAQTGWTTGELLGAIEKSAPSTDYDLVSLLIGVNNQYRGYDISKFRKEFSILLQKAITFAGGRARRVFVVSIPDYGVTPFGRQKNPRKIERELKRYNTIARNIADKNKVTFINITPISKRAASDSTLVAGDGLHPSGRMYGKWVSKMMPAVISKLQ